MQEKDRRKRRVEEMAEESGGKYWRRVEESIGEGEWRRGMRSVEENE